MRLNFLLPISGIVLAAALQKRENGRTESLLPGAERISCPPSHASAQLAPLPAGLAEGQGLEQFSELSSAPAELRYCIVSHGSFQYSSPPTMQGIMRRIVLAHSFLHQRLYATNQCPCRRIFVPNHCYRPQAAGSGRR